MTLTLHEDSRKRLRGLLQELVKHLPHQRKKHPVFARLWGLSSTLTPPDVMAQRGTKRGRFNTFYQSRQEDQTLRQYILTQITQEPPPFKPHILVRGRPLAGKSRLVYEVLRTLDPPVAVLIPKFKDLTLEDCVIPPPPPEAVGSILVLDDLHRYVEFGHFLPLLKEALANPAIMILATCRSGVEYQKVLQILGTPRNNIELEDWFKIVDVGSINKPLARTIAQQAQISWKNVEFDGTVGSVFFKLSIMRRRYRNLKTRPKTVLRALKLAYVAGLYHDRNQFPQLWIKRLLHHKFQLPVKEYVWTELLSNLMNEEFLYSSSAQLVIEEIYLDKIIDAGTSVNLLTEVNILKKTFHDLPQALFQFGQRLSVLGELPHPDRAFYPPIALDVFQLAYKMVESRDQSRCLFNIGLIFEKLGELDDALDHYQQALQIEKKEGNPQLHSARLGDISRILCAQSKFDEALAYSRQALQISEKIDDPKVIMIHLNNTANILHNQGKLDEALTYYQQALQISKKFGSLREIIGSLNNIGLLLHNQGKSDEALDHYQQALQIGEKSEYLTEKAACLNNISSILWNQGKLDEALAYSQQALQIVEKTGNLEGKTACLNMIGLILYTQGKLDEALSCHQQSLQINEQLGSLYKKAACLANIGSVLYCQDKFNEALTYYQQALQIDEELGNLKEKTSLLSKIGVILYRLNRRKEGKSYFHKALILADQMNNSELWDQIQKDLNEIENLFN
ncbi:MAG: tetratricopeptide repeat protein [Candidatus Hermodarchaeota archaeon]